MSYHLQTGVPDWPRTFHLQPQYATFKGFQPQLCDEAKRINPGVLTVMRYWDDENQVFTAGSVSAYMEAARRFFARFVDGTFRTLAHNVDFVEGWNEYLANGQSAAEVRERIMWVDAVTAVWNNEYRTQPEFEHIRLVLCNAAIGNDIPVEMGRIAAARDAVLGYHPYMPMRHGVPFTYREAQAFAGPEALVRKPIPPRAQKPSLRPGEKYPVLIDRVSGIEALGSSGMDDGRRYFWLRWQIMDEWYRAEGIYPEWLFTEFGPLNYEEHAWGLHLDGGGGWRHENTCNGNVEQYIDSILLFSDEVRKWNNTHNGRAIGTPMLFTSGASKNGVWRLFETVQPEMDDINAAMHTLRPSRGANSSPPVPEPEPEPDPDPDMTEVEQEIYSFGKEITDANNDSALQLAMWADGWDIGGAEHWMTSTKDGKQYAVKPAVSKQDKTVVRVYYCEVPKWNEVKWLEPKK
jgi:hypothetical protein